MQSLALMLGSRGFFICRKVKPKWLVDFRWSNGSVTTRSYSGRSTTFARTSKYLVDVLNLLPPAIYLRRLCFHRCLSVHGGGGVFVQGFFIRGSLSGGDSLCPGGILFRGSLSRGSLCQEEPLYGKERAVCILL